jgi:hypothetical protein
MIYPYQDDGTMLVDVEVYISINNEVWKYTFNRAQNVFTFVEVVTQ